FFQAEDGIRDFHVTRVQTCALPIWIRCCGLFFTASRSTKIAKPTSTVAKKTTTVMMSAVVMAAWLPAVRIPYHNSERGRRIKARSEERRVGKEGRWRRAWEREEKRR